jgi:hypothetical protein
MSIHQGGQDGQDGHFYDMVHDEHLDGGRVGLDGQILILVTRSLQMVTWQ